MTEIKTQGRTPGEILRDVECYSSNVGEFAADLRVKLIDPNTDQFKDVNLEFVISAIQTSYDNFKETLKECEGVDVTIQLPDGYVGTIIRLVLEVLGLEL